LGLDILCVRGLPTFWPQ